MKIQVYIKIIILIGLLCGCFGYVYHNNLALKSIMLFFIIINAIGLIISNIND